jgi:uncharacterized protein (TIGR02145 family)
MKIKSALFILLTSVAVCTVHAVNISGVVKNSGGSGIEGVTVRLGKADLAITTGPDGSFTLTDGITGVKHQARWAALGNGCPPIVKNGRFFFDAAKQTQVKVTVYDGNGRLLSSHGEVASPGNHSIPLPHFAAGVHIYHVGMNNDRYTFKRVAGTALNSSMVPSWTTIAPVKQAESATPFDDAILCIKAGFRLSRVVVKKPDTSDLQIMMIPLDTGTVTDADGNVYKTVRIGNQVWTAENLRTTKYNDGTNIPTATSNAAWYCFYGNTTDAAARKKWGALYNWNAVKTGRLAPAGWHVPTDAEWDTLQNYLIANGYNYDGTTSENKIAKSISATTDWTITTETGAISADLSRNNTSGFSALPAGYRYYDGAFTDQKDMAFWWTATERDASYAWYRSLWYINYDLYSTYRMKDIGCSVRLVKNN